MNRDNNFGIILKSNRYNNKFVKHNYQYDKLEDIYQTLNQSDRPQIWIVELDPIYMEDIYWFNCLIKPISKIDLINQINELIEKDNLILFPVYLRKYMNMDIIKIIILLIIQPFFKMGNLCENYECLDISNELVYPPSYRQICILGNGSKGFSQSTGPIIDSHDCTVRMNRIKIKGFEHMVGTKTTHYVFGGNVGLDPKESYDCLNETYLNDPQNKIICVKILKNYCKLNYNADEKNNFTYHKTPFWHQLSYNSRYLTSENTSNIMSTGFYCILSYIIVYLKNHTKINIIGFNFHENYKKGQIDYYYEKNDQPLDEKQKEELLYLQAGHRFDIQKIICQSLIENKIIFGL